VANGPEYTLTDQLTKHDIDLPKLTPAILRTTILIMVGYSMHVSLQNLDSFVIYPVPNITYAGLTFRYVGLTTQTEI